MKRVIIFFIFSIFLITSFQVTAFAEEIYSSEESNTIETEAVWDFEDATEYISVEDIIISDFQNEMYIDDTQNLSATIVPQTATEQTVSYFSSNTKVATINQVGNLKAVGKGDCKIYASCGNKNVYYNLRVKVKTEAINVKSKFVVMKPDEQFDLEPNVQPSNASQNLKFSSTDSNVAAIDNNGIIKAKKAGNAAIIISNDDTTVSVNVIVNKSGSTKDNKDDSDKNKSSAETYQDDLLNKVTNSDEKEIVIEDISIISDEVLKALYGTNKTLIVKKPKYAVSICGTDILNAENEFNIDFSISKKDDGLLIDINSEQTIPGAITIQLKDIYEGYKYLYIYNDDLDEYTKLNTLSEDEFTATSGDFYLLTLNDINGFKINFLYIIGAIGILLILTIIYIFSRKKYWFW